MIACFDDAPRRDRAPARRRRGARSAAACKPIEDDALLDEVTALVERPNVLRVPTSSDEFLAVPQECLILTMKANQKYFPLLDARGQADATRFLDRQQHPPRPIRAPSIGGNERVVRPRLADAKFFFDQDRKKTLADRASRAWPRWSITTSSARRASASSACARIAQRDRARSSAATLWRCRPTRGRAAGQGRPADRHGRRVPRAAGHHGPLLRAARRLSRRKCADAIEDHYKPRFAGDALPRNARRHRGRAGRQAGDAGRHVRHRPAADRRQGSVRAAPPCAGRDAHADRKGPAARAARRCCAQALRGCSRRRTRPRPRVQLPIFIYDRLAGSLREQGYSAQEVDAVLALRPQRAGRCRQAAGGGARIRGAARGRGAGRGQQAHRQHPEEGRRRPIAHVERVAAQGAGRAGAARGAAAVAPAGRRAVRRAATTPPRCRRWPRCARRSMPSSTA